jgi:hypothetical protein
MKNKLDSIWKIFSLVVLMIVSFFMGNFYSLREVENRNAIQITSQTSNNYIENSLSDITFKEIYGLIDGERKLFGSLLIKVVKGKTELFLKLDDIPSSVKLPNNQQKSVPTSYKLKLVKVCCNGLNYEEKNSDAEYTLNLGEKNGKLSGKFNTTLPYDYQAVGIDRIIFSSDVENSFKIVKDDVKDWPSDFLKKPAPYFWSNLK